MRRSMQALPGLTAAAALLVAIAPLAAQRGQQGPPAPPPKPFVPVAASTVIAHPDAYYGERVTMTAAVGQVLSTSAFTLHQDTTAGAGTEVLVLSPVLQGPLDPNGYVTVLGEISHLDPEEIAKKDKNVKVDLAADVLTKYKGQPVLVASSVINKGMIDLTKRMPPPMTADDEALSAIMKKVGPAFAALRNGVQASKADAAVPKAVELKQAFADTEAFWKSHGKADAAGWAAAARKQAEAIEKDASGGKWDAVKASAGTLGQQCQACHTAYRERFDDGSFRIKKAG